MIIENKLQIKINLIKLVKIQSWGINPWSDLATLKNYLKIFTTLIKIDRITPHIFAKEAFKYALNSYK